MIPWGGFTVCQSAGYGAGHCRTASMHPSIVFADCSPATLSLGTARHLSIHVPIDIQISTDTDINFLSETELLRNTEVQDISTRKQHHIRI